MSFDLKAHLIFDSVAELEVIYPIRITDSPPNIGTIKLIERFFSFK